jgi:hypothetical protein
MRGVNGRAKESGLRILGAIGGEHAFEVVSASLRSGRDESDAALEALAQWPDGTPAESLLIYASHTSSRAKRDVAFAGFVRTATLPSDRSSGETVELLRRGRELARDDQEVRLVLGALGQVPHPQALETAERHLSDPAVAHDAARAVLAVAELMAEDRARESMAAVRRVLRQFPDDAAIRQSAGRTANRIERSEDFITAWVFAGPYTKDKHGGGALFDVPFPPESEDDSAGVAWRAIPDEAIIEPGIVNILELEKGGDRCGYLKTVVEVERAQEARLEIGSDDGVKVWLNGEVVHANNAMRGLTVGSDVCTVNLRRGANVLLFKVTQGGGDWRLCCRIRGVDGFALEGVRIDRPRR